MSVSSELFDTYRWYSR